MAEAMTIGELAEASGLSRSTLLYYHRLGLLSPAERTAANYRVYGAADRERVERICFYRQMGIPLKSIAQLLDGVGGRRAAEILQARLHALGREIASLRKQQRCIVAILQQDAMTKENEMITKERWVAVMRAAGMSEDDMHNWHVQFEKMEPDAHGEFLESLGIGKPEIDRIRESSRTGRW